MKRYSLLAVLIVSLLGISCTLGPRYSRPAAPAPAPNAWKAQPPWEQATPKDTVPKGSWWAVYHDATLEGYEQQLLQPNQSLVAARDRLNQARALARVLLSGAIFPCWCTGLRRADRGRLPPPGS